MKFFIFLLLLTLINLSVTNGQETVCREWNADKSTDLSKFFGHWYTYLADIYLVKDNYLCSEYQFNFNEAFNFVDLINTQHYDDNTTKVINGRGHETQYPGIFDIFYENGVVSEMYVVASNEDYALFAGCFKDHVYIRIVTRERNPTDEVKKIIDDKIEENYIDRAELINLCDFA